jgi:UV DNA damage endonuclease
MIRFGLCCIFKEQPIKFRQTTAKALSKLDREAQLCKLSEIALHNANALAEALDFVNLNDIGAFRVLSQILPLYTQPNVRYELDDLPDSKTIRLLYSQTKEFAIKHDIRLSFHPDQFVVLSSLTAKVVENSISELEYQCMVAELIGAENVNIHLGGVYGDKAATIKRFTEVYNSLPALVRKYLTLENDDISYTVEDLYPPCCDLGIPLVYDVHHHRCNPDGLSIEEATDKSIKTWKALKREPHFHISSPKNGWDSPKKRPHSDFIDPDDFPNYWTKFEQCVTVDIEAKAKELAVMQIQFAILNLRNRKDNVYE